MDVLDDLQVAVDGRYEIERELGRGGMAVVYLAHDLKHDRHVAIKVLPPELSTTVGAERFLREIRTAAQLSHPNILPLHESIAVDGVRAYVMPYVQGESLRQRIDRERQLGIEEAVDITRQVAAGLDYAHAHGVVHRDIKPENILLVGHEAVIADFGLARALHAASSPSFTGSGIAVGTPTYMSPEQAAADHSVDGRTDVYALGCVFFEMVAGVPPFRGATPTALMAAHATRPVPSLCEERSACPEAMDAAARRALAKVPADRQHTAGEFAHALEASLASERHADAHRAVRPRWLPLAAGLAAVGAAAVATPRVVDMVQLSRMPLDSTRVAMLPVDGAGGRQLSVTLAQSHLAAALTAWTDLKLVDPPASSPPPSSGREAGNTARRNGAALVLTAKATPMKDSVMIHATLRDLRTNVERQRTVRVADAANVAAPVARMVASLLRDSDAADGELYDAAPGTSVLAAWRAFTRGEAARARWNLADAEKEFRAASTLDPGFAAAHFWLAQVIAWRRTQRIEEWGEPAGRALALASRLPRRDSLMASALVALSARRYPEACATYRALHASAPESDLPWYGLGYCLALDPVVVPMAASPSGWRFRANPLEAAAAFDSALAHADGAPSFAFEMIGALLLVEPLQRRRGRSVPDGRVFDATASLLHDTVAFIPYPAASVDAAAESRLATRGAAFQRSLRRLDRTYQEWVKRAPRSGAAWQALAQVQELEGQPTAIESLQRATALARDPADRLAMSLVRVRLHLKQGRFAAARALADSVVRANETLEGEPAIPIAGAAALAGDLTRAAALLVRASRPETRAVFSSQNPTPPAVVQPAAELLVLSSIGVCGDTLRSLVALIDSRLAQYATEDQREDLRRATVVRPMSLAVPCLGPAVMKGLKSGSRLVRMQQDLAGGDERALRLRFDSVRAARVGLRPGDVSLDHTVQEAWLLLALRDTAAAIRYLDLPLSSLPTLSTHLLDDVPQAAAVGRAFALRAELAAATGDARGARQHAERVLALWDGASPLLQPTITRMRQLAASGPGSRK